MYDDKLGVVLHASSIDTISGFQHHFIQ